MLESEHFLKLSKDVKDYIKHKFEMFMDKYFYGHWNDSITPKGDYIDQQVYDMFSAFVEGVVFIDVSIKDIINKDKKLWDK